MQLQVTIEWQHMEELKNLCPETLNEPYRTTCIEKQNGSRQNWHKVDHLASKETFFLHKWKEMHNWSCNIITAD